jgi:hypothetical protein
MTALLMFIFYPSPNQILENPNSFNPQPDFRQAAVETFLTE